MRDDRLGADISFFLYLTELYYIPVNIFFVFSLVDQGLIDALVLMLGAYAWCLCLVFVFLPMEWLTTGVFLGE